MESTSRAVRVTFTHEFKRNVRALSKKYHHLRSDIQQIIDQLETGNFVGDRIPGTTYVVFKVRVRNRDIQKGKSSGYRLIYQVESPASVILITVYSKLDQGDISANQIRRILAEFDKRRD